MTIEAVPLENGRIKKMHAQHIETIRTKKHPERPPAFTEMQGILGIGAGAAKCTEVRTSWLSSGHALPCSREARGQIGFLRGMGYMDLGLEQALNERSTSSRPARWPRIILQIYPHHQSALRMIPCALEFRNRSRRPAWICKQMHPQLMTLFYNSALKNASCKVFLNTIL